MSLLIKQFGGIDQKSNDLIRQENDFRDARNIQLDINGYVVKKPGSVADDSAPAGTIDSVYIKSMDQKFFVVFESGKIEFYKQVSGVNTKITRFSVDITTSDIGTISGDEYLGTFVFTFTSGLTDTLKYDGETVYLAGLPAPLATTTAGTVDNLRVFYQYTDAKGTVTFGPYTQLTSNGTADVVVNTFNTSGLGAGFFNKYITFSRDVGSPLTLNSGSRTVTYTANNGFSVGDDVWIDAFGNDRGPVITITSGLNNSNLSYSQNCKLTIESINAGASTITFTAASFTNSLNILFTSPTNPYLFTIGSRLRAVISISSTANFGYNAELSIPINSSSTTYTVIRSLITNQNQVLSLFDYYDPTTSKLRPPRCKYICTYGDQLVCGNVVGVYNLFNNFVPYTNNDDIVMYSDISDGDMGENFSIANRQLIGKTFDGSITGVARYNNSVAVFKTRGVYAMDGVLAIGEYNLRKIPSNGIGCTSHKSILETDSFLAFQGQDGLYSFTGYKIEKITTPLDNLFASIDNTKTRSAMYQDKDKWIFYVTNNSSHYFVVYDFNFKRWYIWDGVNSSKGLYTDNSNIVKFLGSSALKLSTGTYTDNSVLFTAYFDSSWFDLKNPSLQKKANSVRLFTSNNTGAIYTITHWFDWNTSLPKTSAVQIPAGKNTVLAKLDIRTCQSWSVRISNAENKDISISGIDYGIEPVQTSDSNV